MDKEGDSPSGEWALPAPRALMLAEVKTLPGAARAGRLAIAFSKEGHIEDEVVVTLALEARRAKDAQAENEYASVVLQRIVKHVTAHVRKNPPWQSLGGGAEAVVDDFSQSVALAIFADSRVPCHAQVAFGDYVWKRVLDQAEKLFAKKHSGETLDEDIEAVAQWGDADAKSTATMSPEELLIFLQGEAEEAATLEKILQLVQTAPMSEKAQIAFTFRYYGQLPVESKKDGVVSIAMLMGISEKTVKKYIDEAIAVIRKELKS